MQPRHQRRHRGFTLTEVLVAVVVLGFLGAMLLPSLQAAVGNNARTSENLALAGTVTQARSIAARDGNGYQYPASLAADLAEVDARHVTGPAGDGEVSIYRTSGDVAVFAAWADGGQCVVAVDRIDTDVQSWAVDDTTSVCDAADAAASVASITGSAFEPTSIDL